MANFSTQQFLQDYFDALTANSSIGYDFWESIMESIRSRNSIPQSMYETLEQLVNQRLDKLGTDQLIAIYRETENWLLADDPSESNLSIELIKIELVRTYKNRISRRADGSNNKYCMGSGEKGTLKVELLANQAIKPTVILQRFAQTLCLWCYDSVRCTAAYGER